MNQNSLNIEAVLAALNTCAYRNARSITHPEPGYNKLVDKFYSGKPVTLDELNQASESEASCWAYVRSLLTVFPTHAAMALEGKWNGQAIANGMVLAHAVTRATTFLPLEDFLFVFATLLRHPEAGGICFEQVASSHDAADQLNRRWQEVFVGWIKDVISSRQHTLDVAMHTAGTRFFGLGAQLLGIDERNPRPDDEIACIEAIKAMLSGERGHLPANTPAGAPAQQRHETRLELHPSTAPERGERHADYRHPQTRAREIAA